MSQLSCIGPSCLEFTFNPASQRDPRLSRLASGDCGADVFSIDSEYETSQRMPVYLSMIEVLILSSGSSLFGCRESDGNCRAQERLLTFAILPLFWCWVFGV
ncbi:hypothetical protein CJ030_MR4G015456 [Morella rubra]|uniref:Uncharacterized protein n=1 Tax=Morella rubra TaxID=262757 RepID=A0A6A1VV58_9ROSI|nr:hypothetical protein CJ030_MR4G015456 [Morella rubra]